MNKSLFLYAFLLLHYSLQDGYAQGRSSVTGYIIEKENGSPIQYATVALLNPVDSSVVTGGVTSSDGSFNLPAKPGTYLLKVQFVTYETLDIPNVEVSSGRSNFLGELALEEASQQLDEIIVQAEKTQMELRLDKKVYNVGQDLSNLGGTATDILENLPAVTVDVEGNVELRGSSNVRILIDGKPSGLVGLSSTDALRQLQGNMVERVEIITNPSARYDAEGMAGIINIVLKKEEKKGVNGSFQVNTGYPHNHGVSANVNFRREKINFFINYGLNLRETFGGGYSNQRYNLDSTAGTTGESDFLTKLKRNHTRGGLSNSVRFGADYFLTPQATLTAAFLYRYSDELNETTLRYYDKDLNGALFAYTERQDEEKEGDENLEYALNFTKNFDREDQKWTADIQYQHNNEIEKSDILQLEGKSVPESLPVLYQKVKNDEGEKRLMVQSDYIHPFGLDNSFEAGFRSTIRNIKNIYDVSERENPLAEFIPLEEFSTDFDYNERVHAAYTILNNEGKVLSWQVGVRSELTDIRTDQQEIGVKRRWTYINFFPSAFITYKLNPEVQLQMSYSRRINRPYFRELNPFSSFSDNRNFRVGNPELQPEFTDAYEFGILQNLEKSSIYYGVYYRFTDGLINRVNLEPNASGQRIRKPFNIGQRHDLGMETNITHEFAGWYNVSGNLNFYRGETIGSVGDSISLGAKAITFNGRVSNIFRFPHNLDAQVNFSYRAPEARPQGRRYAMAELDLGLSKDIIKNNGTLAVSVNDVFNTGRYRFTNRTEGFYERGSWQWRRGPMATLTFTYRLNQKKERTRRDSRENGGRVDDGF